MSEPMGGDAKGRTYAIREFLWHFQQVALPLFASEWGVNYNIPGCWVFREICGWVGLEAKEWPVASFALNRQMTQWVKREGGLPADDEQMHRADLQGCCVERLGPDLGPLALWKGRLVLMVEGKWVSDLHLGVYHWAIGGISLAPFSAEVQTVPSRLSPWKRFQLANGCGAMYCFLFEDRGYTVLPTWGLTLQAGRVYGRILRQLVERGHQQNEFRYLLGGPREPGCEG